MISLDKVKEQTNQLTKKEKESINAILRVLERQCEEWWRYYDYNQRHEQEEFDKGYDGGAKHACMWLQSDLKSIIKMLEKGEE